MWELKREKELLPDFPDVPEDGDYEAGYTRVLGAFRAAARSLSMRARWVTWITRATAGVAAAAVIVIVSAVIIFVVVTPLADDITDLVNGRAPVSVAARQRAAEERYLQCFLARDDLAMVSADERADAENLCDGYTTLLEAYETQGVKPPD